MIVDRIYQYYEQQREMEPPRHHLGGSEIGHVCARYVWLNYRWFAKEQLPGRRVRLLNTGKIEETRILKELEAIGVQLHYIDNDPDAQHRVYAYGGHFGGSLDAIATHVDPDDLDKPYIFEFKTSNAKAFKTLKSQEVKKAKWQHYVQMQIYMGQTKIHQAIYLAVCKDTDELYEEIVLFDKEVYDEHMQRAQEIIKSPTPPAHLPGGVQRDECKQCSMRNVCHFGARIKKNCRTCVFASPHPSGEWFCNKANATLNKEQQVAGCSEYSAIEL